MDSELAGVRSDEAIVVSRPLGFADDSVSDLGLVKRDHIIRIIKKRGRLAASEVRFLRGRLNFSRQRMALGLNVALNSLEAWECGWGTVAPAVEIRLRLLSAERQGFILNVYELMKSLIGDHDRTRPGSLE